MNLTWDRYDYSNVGKFAAGPVDEFPFGFTSEGSHLTLMAEQGQGAIWVTQLCTAVLRYTLTKKKFRAASSSMSILFSPLSVFNSRQASVMMKSQHLAAISESVFGLGGRPLFVLLILVAFAGRTVKMDGGMMVPRAADSWVPWSWHFVRRANMPWKSQWRESNQPL